MLIALDVGNTNIKTGLFEQGKLLHSWRISSSRERTADEMGIMMESFFAHVGVSLRSVEGIIVSSVIPGINYTISHMCRLYFHQKPMFVHADMDTGLNICYCPPRDLGADRICTAVAAHALCKKACITIDFGTATSFGAVSSAGDFLGGVICPGVKVASDALVERTAQLAKVELRQPKRVIGADTISGIQSGLVHGYVGQVDYLIERICEEMDDSDIELIATGGMAQLVTAESKYLKNIHPTLSLEGLRILYERNVGMDQAFWIDSKMEDETFI